MVGMFGEIKAKNFPQVIPRIAGTRLTPRELECVVHMAAGYSSTETAVLLGIDNRTMSAYLYRARLRLEAKTNLQAVLIAYEQGIIVKVQEHFCLNRQEQDRVDAPDRPLRSRN